MCNSHNHSAGCTCGFGGEGHLGGGSLTESYAFQPRTYNSTVQEYKHDDVCSPTTCQYCQSEIYFVRHNGGSVWLDELGAPWNKHQCFYPDDSPPVISTKDVPNKWTVGIISRIKIIKKGEAKITLNTLAGNVREHDYTYPDYYDFIAEYLGSLVMINNQNLTLKKVHTPKAKKQHLEMMRVK
ncbi:hypothetical protein [Colwellia sp. 12G3]|uniref:hypothetical protein n=1 Tax=Colwellia sp. 12G3 TaxID=2058299 RepID=UPI000C31BAFE|nr:hypothetical protein [Colwellia sp. 12G3]PKI12781.1 hypothetical protein CXF71_18785 [Colwellia sp. 12G3]